MLIRSAPPRASGPGIVTRSAPPWPGLGMVIPVGTLLLVLGLVLPVGTLLLVLGLVLVAGCSSSPAASSAGPTPLVKTFSKDAGGGAIGGTDLPPEGGMVLVGATNEMVAAAARALNMDEQSLRSAWSARPLAEIARERGVEPGTLVEQMTTAEHERLLKEAAAGRVAPSDVQALRDAFAQAVSRLIQQPLAAPPGG